MTDEPVHATLFAYQVGFGDCFLLRFDYAHSRRRHILVDFGSTSLPDGASTDHMMLVAKDIAEKCADGGDGLDMLVATHRHADHINGFATAENGSPQRPGDIIATLDPALVVQPWTESPKAPVDWLGPRNGSRSRAFADHRAGLHAMHATAAQVLRFVDSPERRLPSALAAELRFLGEGNLANLSAVRNLARMGRRHEYVFHGCDLDVSQELPGIKIDVLGPPTLRQTESIRRQRSRDRDEFWQLTARRMTAAADGCDGPPLFPDAETVPGTRMKVEYRWLQRRIDAAEAGIVLGLVRALDQQMNNTSVIMIIRAGRKTLLFPGDAQLENWQFALSSSLADLLNDVDLYKVGHHGSLNATPKSMWNRFRKRGRISMPERLTSVVSTKHGKHGSEEKNTEVPRRTLISELDARSDLITTETVGSGNLCRAIEIPLA